jgi:hypothetical protein
MSKAKYQLEDFLAIVNDNYKDFINTVHEMMLQNGYKLKIQSTKLYGFHISYSQPKIKTVNGIILYFLLSNGKLMIRINAFNHDKYPDVLNRLPENIVSQIDKADTCKKSIDPQKCWQGCMGYDFNIKGKRYQKCLCTCFLIEVDSESIPFLTELVESESKERLLSSEII